MIRNKVALAIAVVGLVVAIPLGRAVAAPDPVPTAERPLQGMRRLTVATIPAVPGMPFSIDGRTFTADAQGVATTLVTKSQREAVRAARGDHLLVMDPEFEPAPGVRARFTGWFGEGVYRPRASPDAVPEEYQRATFDVEYLTDFAFATPTGERVRPGELTDIRLMSSLGSRLRLAPPRRAWLQGSRTTTGPLGLQSRAVSYRVEAVTASGSNVVNQGQQQFFPSERQNLTVRLLFFDVVLGARDALLGTRTGSSVKLEYPNGHERTLELGKRGTVTARRLPRGDYRVTVQGSGPSMSQELTVSRDERVELDAITWIDVGLFAALLAFVVVGLYLMRRFVRRRAVRTELDLAAAERSTDPRELVRT